MKILHMFLQAIVLHNIRVHGRVYSGKLLRNTGGLEQQYPNLYFSIKDLPKLRTLASSSHAELYKEMFKIIRDLKSKKNLIPPESVTLFNSEWNEQYGNLLGILAIYCAFTPGDHEAVDLTKLFMKRLTSYSTWFVTGKETDEVPVAHSLLGYATAFDCLHNLLTPEERGRFASKLLQTGTLMFSAANKIWWGRSYIHNHVATNYMALLTAALVLQPYHPGTVAAWMAKSVTALNATMEYLKLVVDGSLQEGVSYGTYTMRSMTQFMFISERHFTHNYRTNNWLRKHFDFLLYTIMPGFQLTVGFADSNLNWAYGPESQLEFLEGYMHENGRAKWLSNEIKKHWNTSTATKSIVHTEFLFYNSTVEPKPSSKVKLHVFSDWGVLVYGGGIPDPHVFLSFKCSHLHGRAINLLRPSLNVDTQRGFVPGHEQPDQGSFVFVTEDQPVITDSRYGPKYTYLQNTLMFGPSTKGCTLPFLGQLGECHKWFNHKQDSRTWVARADLVGYSRENDVIFMSGEMTQVYDTDLGLANVYRALVMLTPDVLVVVDVVRFRADSVTTHASAFFHNSDFVFNVDAYNDKNLCAGIGNYKMCWQHLNAHTVNVSTRNKIEITRKKLSTNFVNITWKRSELLTSTAYIFHGPKYTLKQLKLSEITDSGINIGLKLNSVKYNITLSTRHNDPRSRRKLLGTNGYGKVNIMSENTFSTLHLGVKIVDQGGDVSRTNDFSQMTSHIPISQSTHSNQDHGYSIAIGYFLVSGALLLFCLKFKPHQRLWKKFVAVFVLLIGLTIIFVYITSSYVQSKSSLLPLHSTFHSTPENSHHLTRENNHALNAVLITGLPSNGVELARELFTTNPDFITVHVGSKARDKDNLDLREWKGVTLDQKLAKWWNTMLNAPTTLRSVREHIALVNPLDLASRHGTVIQKSESAFAAISFKNPGWLFRMQVLFEHKQQVPLLYVVRDPRGWIEHMFGRPDEMKLFLNDFHTAMETTCCSFPQEILHLRGMNFTSLKPHLALAYIWNAFTTYAVRLKSVFPHGGVKIVLFKDVITSPRETADAVYSFLEMPFPATVEHRIMQLTETGLYKFEGYGTIDSNLCKWGEILTESQVAEIHSVCKHAMIKIGSVGIW